jgi:hypothetical protein
VIQKEKMQCKFRNYTTSALAFGLFFLASLSCRAAGSPAQTAPVVMTQVIAIPQIATDAEIPSDLNAPLKPEIILQRLNVSFSGQGEKKVIGSGCPGTDGKGAIIDYHFVVSGVDENKEVQRVLVAGDNSTLTWASPCSNNWALEAVNLGNGNWEIFIAPSLPSKIYTVFFFYTDSSIAIGMENTE